MSKQHVSKQACFISVALDNAQGGQYGDDIADKIDSRIKLMNRNMMNRASSVPTVGAYAHLKNKGHALEKAIAKCDESINKLPDDKNTGKKAAKLIAGIFVRIGAVGLLNHAKKREIADNIEGAMIDYAADC